MQLVILDRDGVINFDSEHYIKSPEEWLALPGSLEAIHTLNQQQINTAVATNQAGVAKGYLSLESLYAIHQKLRDELAAMNAHLDAIFYCPHHPDQHCSCRKPQPGLLFQALEHFHMSSDQACMVGDSLRDIQAARAAQCEAILVLTGNGEKTWANHKTELGDIAVYDNLLSFAEQHLSRKTTC